MPEIFIIADPDSSSSPPLKGSSIATEMRQAILDSEGADRRVAVLLTTELDPLKQKIQDGSTGLFCPLTFNVPEWLTIPNRNIYTACANLDKLRQIVSQWHYRVGDGTNWLPIVWTTKGPLYGEAIAQINGMDAPTYQQPLHLVDLHRQPLYRLGKTLLSTLGALPGVYLMQFGVKEDGVWFDRLIPFPDAPAIASLNIQTPNLFLCHWLCLTNQPIQDLNISAV